jgi:hypothetical protein
LFNFRYKKIKTYGSFIYIFWRGPTAVVHRNESVLKNILIHNDRTYITEDYTKLCLNIICNRSFFILKWCQLCSGPSFTQGWKDIVQGFQSGPVPGTFTRLRSCMVPAEITEPPKISGGQNHKYDRLVEYFS